jgi:peptidoglycan/xylan/chitin deacetylase (PgdA/CDA1 family)
MKYFHRIDDVGENSPVLNEILDVFEELNEIVYLAIVPTHLEKTLANRISNSHNIRFMQHGYDHVNNSDVSQKDEFPNSLDEEFILQKIREGNEILAKMLGTSIDHYCPPWNHTSGTAIKIIEMLGFTTISGDDFIPLNTKLNKLNINIDSASSYRPIRIKDTEKILQEVRESDTERIGIMHHLDGIDKEEVESLKHTITQINKYFTNV